MNDKTLQAVIACKKSYRLLSLLDSNPRNFEWLCISSRMCTKEYLLALKFLEENHLITGENDTYRLTSQGEEIIEKLEPFSFIEEFVNTADGTGQNHSLDFIPSYLLRKLCEINSCNLIQLYISNIFDYSKEIHETSKSSVCVYLAAAGLYPSFPKLFSHLIDNGVSLSLLFDSCLYGKLRRDRSEMLRELVNNKQVTIYVYPKKMHIFSFVVNDLGLFLEPLTREGNHSNKLFFCNSPEAIQWGRELFEYYIKGSMLVTEI